jgi:hypothetical protein
MHPVILLCSEQNFSVKTIILFIWLNYIARTFFGVEVSSKSTVIFYPHDNSYCFNQSSLYLYASELPCEEIVQESNNVVYMNVCVFTVLAGGI